MRAPNEVMLVVLALVGLVLAFACAGSSGLYPGLERLEWPLGSGH